MSKKTVLELVQDILNDMDSDEVNSITDTIEASQVAQIIKTTYEELMDGRYWPHLSTLSVLTASGDADKPTHMTLPEKVQTVEWVKYNKRKSTDSKDKFSEVDYLEPKDFLELLNTRDSSDTTEIKVVTDDSGITLNIRKTVAPTYYTSFDDETLVFDSYDSTVDSTLQSSKTQIEIYKEPTFLLVDTHIPDLPSKNFSYLLAEAKSVAFNALRQSANTKEEQKSRRQRTWSSREKWRTNGGIKFPDYGRKT